MSGQFDIRYKGGGVRPGGSIIAFLAVYNMYTNLLLLVPYIRLTLYECEE